MDKKKAIMGTAETNGLDRVALQECSGIAPRTFDRRMADPDKITIGELRGLTEAGGLPDDLLIKLIREPHAATAAELRRIRRSDRIRRKKRAK